MHECSFCSDKLYNLEYDVALVVSNRGTETFVGAKTNILVSMASQQSVNQQMTDSSAKTCMLFNTLQQHPHVFIPGVRHYLLTIQMRCFWLRTTVFLWLLLLLPGGPLSAKGIRCFKETMKDNVCMLCILVAKCWCHVSKQNKTQCFIIFCSAFKECIIYLSIMLGPLMKVKNIIHSLPQ